MKTKTPYSLVLDYCKIKVLHVVYDFQEQNVCKAACDMIEAE